MRQHGEQDLGLLGDGGGRVSPACPLAHQRRRLVPGPVVDYEITAAALKIPRHAAAHRAQPDESHSCGGHGNFAGSGRRTGSTRRPQTVSARRAQAASKAAGNRTSATAVATIPNTTIAGTAHIVATSAPSPRGAEGGRAF